MAVFNTSKMVAKIDHTSFFGIACITKVNCKGNGSVQDTGKAFDGSTGKTNQKFRNYRISIIGEEQNIKIGLDYHYYFKEKILLINLMNKL